MALYARYLSGLPPVSDGEGGKGGVPKVNLAPPFIPSHSARRC